MSQINDKISRAFNCTDKEMEQYFLGVTRFYKVLFQTEGTGGKSYAKEKSEKWLEIVKDMQLVPTSYFGDPKTCENLG